MFHEILNHPIKLIIEYDKSSKNKVSNSKTNI
jgi:hypothetical protein